jgi:hypothetical protein
LLADASEWVPLGVWMSWRHLFLMGCEVFMRSDVLVRGVTPEAEALRRMELARTMKKLGSCPLTKEQKAAVEAMTRALTGRLLGPVARRV